MSRRRIFLANRNEKRKYFFQRGRSIFDRLSSLIRLMCCGLFSMANHRERVEQRARTFLLSKSALR